MVGLLAKYISECGLLRRVVVRDLIGFKFFYSLFHLQYFFSELPDKYNFCNRLSTKVNSSYFCRESSYTFKNSSHIVASDLQFSTFRLIVGFVLLVCRLSQISRTCLQQRRQLCMRICWRRL